MLRVSSALATKQLRFAEESDLEMEGEGGSVPTYSFRNELCSGVTGMERKRMSDHDLQKGVIL
jgi:hypothetical protein